VDFVPEIVIFNPHKKTWDGDLFLKRMVFRGNGELSMNHDPPNQAIRWTKGAVIDEAGQTASAYVIKNMNGNTFMFFEWKSGDYTNRHMRPYYYVLKKSSF